MRRGQIGWHGDGRAPAGSSTIPSTHESHDAAFNALYRAHRGDISKLCLGILHDSGDAEDATEEAFVKAWRALLDGKAESCTYPWLRVVARNHCYDVLRKRGRSHPVDTPVLEAVSPSLDGCDGEIIDRVEADLAWESVRRVSPSHRSILALREGQALSYQEIADLESIPLSSVESRLYRARRALRREFLTLVGPEGVASLIWLRIRGRWFDAHVAIAPNLGGFSGRMAPVSSASGSAVGGMVAATAVAALATISAVNPLPHHVAPVFPVIPATTAAASPHTTSNDAIFGTGVGQPHITTDPKIAVSGSQAPLTSHVRLPERVALARAGSVGTAAASAVRAADAAATAGSTAPIPGGTSSNSSGNTSSTSAILTDVNTPSSTSAGPQSSASGGGGTIGTVSATNSTTTTASQSFGDQLVATSGTQGTVTFLQSTGVSVLVSRAGVVSTSGPLAAGTYAASGTDSDSAGDNGSWNYTLTVKPMTIVNTVPSASTQEGSSATFTEQLVASGSVGSVTYVEVTSSGAIGLKVSSSGVVSTTGALAPGAYEVTGNDSDAYGDSGTWSFILYVSAQSPTSAQSNSAQSPSGD